MTSKICPICRGAWYDTHKYNDLCKEHSRSLTWYVTLCLRCQCYCFSPYIGLCVDCAEGLNELNRYRENKIEETSSGVEG